MFFAAPLEQCDHAGGITTAVRQVVGVRRKARKPIERCGQYLPIRARRIGAEQIARAGYICAADVFAA
jgi:hypothetical protein